MRIENPILIIMRNNTSDESCTFHIHPELISNASEAGLIFADAAKHMANALVQTGKATDTEEALSQIRALFDAELDTPTQQADGQIVQ